MTGAIMHIEAEMFSASDVVHSSRALDPYSNEQTGTLAWPKRLPLAMPCMAETLPQRFA
jgi:hypothetical protein